MKIPKQSSFFHFSYYMKAQQVRENVEEYTEKHNRRGCTVAYTQAFKWFKNYEKNADHTPNCATKTLPSCLSKTPVFHLYWEQMAGKPMLTCTSFVYGMWKKHFANIIIPKVGRNKTMYFTYIFLGACFRATFISQG